MNARRACAERWKLDVPSQSDGARGITAPQALAPL